MERYNAGSQKDTISHICLMPITTILTAENKQINIFACICNQLTGKTTHVEVVVEGSPQILLEDTVDLICTKTGGHERVLAVAVLVQRGLDVLDQLLVLLRAGERLVDALDHVGSRSGEAGEAAEDGIGDQTGGEGGTGRDEGLGVVNGLDDLGGLLGGDDRGGNSGRGEGDGGGGTGHLADLLEDLAGGGPLGAVGHLELGGDAGGGRGAHGLGGEGSGLGGGAEEDEGGGELHRCKY